MDVPKFKIHSKEEILMRKIMLVVLMLIFVFGVSNISLASYNINAILNKEYAIIYNGEEKPFYNGNGEKVYPILFEGTNYLPLRAVSSLFNIPISWDGQNNTVYLGNGEINKTPIPMNSNLSKEKNEDIIALVNQEVKVVYNGETQIFRMDMGDYRKTIYPITFKGTTYLPIRNITELFDCTIEWDGTNKLIKINSLNHIVENKNPTAKKNNVYNNGNDYVMYNDDIYFRIYEEDDYYKEYMNLLYHRYDKTSGERTIGKINKNGEVSKIFKNDSSGKFYILDDRFFFKNNAGDIYSTDLLGKNKISFGTAEFKDIDEANHILTILKNDGLYEISTINLQLSKKSNRNYEVTLDTIKSRYFSKDNVDIYLLHKGEDRILYHTVNDDSFDIYSFDYRTEGNKKMASLSRQLDLEEWVPDKRANNIKYIAQYGKNIYVCVYSVGGTIGDMAGILWAIDNNGNIKEILKLNYEFINYTIDDNLMYLDITSTVGSGRQYILHMDTNTLADFESNIQDYETNKLAQIANQILEKRFTKDFCNNIIAEFDTENIRKELNQKNVNDNDSGIHVSGDMWDESVFEQAHRYDLNDKFIYEYIVAVHGWPSWRGEYRGVGVIYFLVDTNSGSIKEIYRIKF